MPDAAGKFKGISVPELPWLLTQDELAAEIARLQALGGYPQRVAVLKRLVN